MNVRLNKKALRNKFNVQDEMYTPRKLVMPIIDYVKMKMPYEKKIIVWCPFDTEESEFVIALKEIKNVEVIHSHISEGKDFFNWEPEKWDLIVSNPPFSKKLEVFERLYKLNKPFAVLMNLMALNYQNVGNFFVGKDVQMLIVDKKMSFDGRTSSFNTSYICRNMLDKDLIFTHVADNNTGNNFIPAAMYRGDKNECKIVKSN